MRISDWSSDVCSSDLHRQVAEAHIIDEDEQYVGLARRGDRGRRSRRRGRPRPGPRNAHERREHGGRGTAGQALTRVVTGKSVTVRVHVGGLLLINIQKENDHHYTVKFY